MQRTISFHILHASKKTIYIYRAILLLRVGKICVVCCVSCEKQVQIACWVFKVANPGLFTNKGTY